MIMDRTGMMIEEIARVKPQQQTIRPEWACGINKKIVKLLWAANAFRG